jgi:hypothetical protein
MFKPITGEPSLSHENLQWSDLMKEKIPNLAGMFMAEGEQRGD